MYGTMAEAARSIPCRMAPHDHVLARFMEFWLLFVAKQIGVLLVVAGYQHLDKLGGLDAEGLRQHFEVNAIGPILAVQALRQNIGQGTKVALRSCPSSHHGCMHSTVSAAAGLILRLLAARWCSWPAKWGPAETAGRAEVW